MSVDASFIRNRITELREFKQVSESKMSFDLGKSKGYIQGISRGDYLPKLEQFLEICEYLGVTPAEFFSEETLDPYQVNELLPKLKQMTHDQVELISKLIDQFIQ